MGKGSASQVTNKMIVDNTTILGSMAKTLPAWCHTREKAHPNSVYRSMNLRHKQDDLPADVCKGVATMCA